jgi:hypothetical protein
MSSPKTKTMKKLALFAIAAFILSTGLMGQKKNAVKTDLFSAFLRTGVFKYERALNDDMGFQLGFFYTGYSPGDTDARLSGFRYHALNSGITFQNRIRLPMEPIWLPTSAT